MPVRDDEINPFIDPARADERGGPGSTLVVGDGVALTLTADALNVLGP